MAVSRCKACRFAGPESCGVARFGRVAPDLAAPPILPVLGNEVRFPPAVAAALPVGLALVRPVVCFEDTLPWSEAERAPWLDASRYGVPIVDHAGALVGLLPSTQGAVAVGSWPGGAASVGDHAVSAVSVDEGESLGEAFALMGRHRVREVTAVGEGLRVVGVLRDVDALRFVAYVARSGGLPAFGRTGSA